MLGGGEGKGAHVAGLGQEFGGYESVRHFIMLSNKTSS